MQKFKKHQVSKLPKGKSHKKERDYFVKSRESIVKRKLKTKDM